MIDAFTAPVGALFGVWLVLTALNQYKRGVLIRPIKRRDVFSLVPTWTFFAPRPGVTDYNILYRDRCAEGTVSAWYEVNPVRDTPLKVFWNPGKRVRKGVNDMCNSLLRNPVRRQKRVIIELPYITLLNHAGTEPRTPVSESRQFMIARSDGYRLLEEPAIVFVSGFHELEEALL